MCAPLHTSDLGTEDCRRARPIASSFLYMDAVSMCRIPACSAIETAEETSAGEALNVPRPTLGRSTPFRSRMVLSIAGRSSRRMAYV